MFSVSRERSFQSKVKDSLSYEDFVLFTLAWLICFLNFYSQTTFTEISGTVFCWNIPVRPSKIDYEVSGPSLESWCCMHGYRCESPMPFNFVLWCIRKRVTRTIQYPFRDLKRNLKPEPALIIITKNQ